MKKVRTLMALAIVMMLAGCASTNTGFLSVGNVSNTECQRGTRAVTRPEPMLRLTMLGNNINGDFIDYPANCDGEIGVSCRQEGPKFDIKVTQTQDEGEIGTYCSCSVNIYFTVYNIEGENFHLIVNDKDIGNVSFKESSIVEINLWTKEVKYGISGDV